MRTLGKILLWSLLAVVLLIAGCLASTVRLLRSERLTPLTVEAANKLLDANVDIDKVELELKSSFPFLNLNIDKLSIVSRKMLRLPQAARDTIPANADTLLRIGHLQGGINLARLLTRTIALNDVVIDRPMVNLVIVNDTINNFSILGEADTASASDTTRSATGASVPDIRIKSFRITNPEPIRYTDLATRTALAASLTKAQLVSDSQPPVKSPLYNITLDTNIDSPLLSYLGLASFPIDCDGLIEWDHNLPLEISLADFHFVVSKLSGVVETTLDFSDELTVKHLHIDVDPLSVSEAIAMLPEETCRQFAIPRDIRTDATLALTIRLLEPYVAGSATIPHAQAEMEVAPCYVKWEKLDIERLWLQAVATTHGDDLDLATLDIKNLEMRGPATSIDLRGVASQVMSDPTFDGRIDGHIDLSKLPPVLTDMLDDAYTTGTISLATDMRVSQSMLSRDKFHQLQLKGDVKLDNVYYLASDTLSLYYVRHGVLKFGTNEEITKETSRGTRRLDSLLSATVDIDSARIMVGGLDMRARNFALGVHALNNKDVASDTTAIIPMGGNISTTTFSLFTISDSSGVKVRDLAGSVSMQRYKGDAHLPLFRLNTSIGRVSTGNNTTRFMMSKTRLNVRLNKLPDNQLTEHRRQVKHIADSLHRAKPHIPIDSVYHMAMEIRRRRNPRHGHRVHGEMTAQEQEIIEWGTSPAFQRFLTDWKLQGTFTADRAGLFTASFPIRNRVRNLNAKFNNDSIILQDVLYKAGHSDFTISGSVSNIAKALTSRDGRQPLRINFEMISDTIDVNQLAHACFTGAANGDRKLQGNLDDEAAMEHAATHSEKPDSVGPFLIPVNIDGEFRLQADNVLYADFLLHNLQGTALAYDGALNLHDLSAASSVGSISLSALYSAPTPKDMKFGFGMDLADFNIHHFLQLVPAVDSMMPMMRDLGGIIDAKIAATADVDPNMNLVIPSLNAAIHLKGDSIVFLDPETFKKVAKWLLFRNKEENMIKHMSVDLVVEDNTMKLFPFVFDFDRYKLGVQGYNDLDMNYDYHIAVLKSPIPFKFGINIRGHGDDYKIRLGRARFNEAQAVENVALADTTRVNLINQLQGVFRRGVRNSDFAKVRIDKRPMAESIDLETDTLTAADSLYFRQQGLLPSTSASSGAR